jgi:DNA invertase Pin-like site-specific DNA recombinase
VEGIHLLYLEINKIFSLSCQPICNSAKNTARPKFQEMLSYVREGDMIVVHSMDRFARSLKDLVTEVDQLVKRGIAIQFVKENITFTAQATPMDNLMLQLMGAFAQFEREIILERQKEGLSSQQLKGNIKDESIN